MKMKWGQGFFSSIGFGSAEAICLSTHSRGKPRDILDELVTNSVFVRHHFKSATRPALTFYTYEK